MKKLSIIIPCFNESATITQVLHSVAQVQLGWSLEKEIIVVDDASADGTPAAVAVFFENHKHLAGHLLQHGQNKGKGAAVKSGIAKATGDIIVIQDADLEYDPQEYNKLLQPILTGHADVVYGSRFKGEGPHRVLFFLHTIGNKLLTFISNIFTGFNLTDMETGFKTFRADILRKVTLKESRFGFEPEVTARISRIKGIRVYEVGVAYYGRTYEKGKKITWKDGLRAVYCIIRYNIFDRS